MPNRVSAGTVPPISTFVELKPAELFYYPASPQNIWLKLFPLTLADAPFNGRAVNLKDGTIGSFSPSTEITRLSSVTIRTES